MPRNTALYGESRLMRRAFRSILNALPAALIALTPSLSVHAQSEPPFDVARLYLELNDTDGDLGIHSVINAAPWYRLAIDEPGGKRILDVNLAHGMKSQGLTEFFFESAEPKFHELSPKEFLARFPEGGYRISATTLNGKSVSSVANLSHIIPAAPGNLRVSGAATPKDCDDGPVPAVGKPAVITWDAVTKYHSKLGRSGAVAVESYEVVVEREEPTSATVNAVLPPEARSFEVPAGFLALDSGDGFKFEVIVKSTNGNQTATETCFKLK